MTTIIIIAGISLTANILLVPLCAIFYMRGKRHENIAYKWANKVLTNSKLVSNTWRYNAIQKEFLDDFYPNEND